MNDREPVALRCSAVVLRKETVLLCRRPESDAWVLPGGSPRGGEGSAACARREVLEETGLAIDAERIAFVLEATSPDSSLHLIEIVFVGTDREPNTAPREIEPGLVPQFVPLSDLSARTLLPPIGGYLRGLARGSTRGFGAMSGTAPYLGNVWRPARIDVEREEEDSESTA
jgi:ADP-ribose pyrophosphatase YjhB (NUDIX family)